MRNLDASPAELEDDDEAGVVDQLRVLVRVLAADAPEEDEGKGEEDADRSEEMPRLPAAELAT